MTENKSDGTEGGVRGGGGKMEEGGIEKIELEIDEKTDIEIDNLKERKKEENETTMQILPSRLNKRRRT